MSWDAIDRTTDEKKTVIDNPHAAKFNRLVYQVLEESEKGRELFFMIKKKYLFQPVCDPSLSPSHGYYREGQNSIIRELDACINNFLKTTNEVNE